MSALSTSKAKILVTGGAGFIGSNLVRELLVRGDEVVVLDNLCNGLRSNLPDHERLRFLEGDIRDPETVADAVAGCQVVFHEAAIGSVPRSMREPLTFYENNIKGSAVVFEAARAAGVRRVVWASSSSVYGDTAADHKCEGEEGAPVSPYAASKAAVEVIATAHAMAFDQDIVGLRYFNVYGPYQRPDSAYAAVVPLFLTAVQNGKPAKIFGDGEQVRDFSFVADVVAANLAAASADKVFRGAVFNVSGGHSYSVNELLRAATDAAGAEYLQPEYLAQRRGDIRRSKADLSQIRAALGYEPSVSLSEGLRQAWEWLAARP